MKTLIALLILSSLPLTALADEARCEHSQPRELQLDLSGVRTLMFDIGPHELSLEARSGAGGRIGGRACASSQSLLEHLVLRQERDGDRLLVHAGYEGNWSPFSFNRYARLHLSGTVPDDVLVQLKVGSGDAELRGAAAMSADVGSGDLAARDIRGKVSAEVGSGDLEFERIGALELHSVGSGDVIAREVRGDVEVGSIGSGDFELEKAGGNVEIGRVGSGDVDLSAIDGDVRVRSIGSGDVDAHGIGGDLTVSSKGSGDIDHSGVAGSVEIPDRR